MRYVLDETNPYERKLLSAIRTYRAALDQLDRSKADLVSVLNEWPEGKRRPLTATAALVGVSKPTVHRWLTDHAPDAH